MARKPYMLRKMSEPNRQNKNQWRVYHAGEQWGLIWESDRTPGLFYGRIVHARGNTHAFAFYRDACAAKLWQRWNA